MLVALSFSYGLSVKTMFYLRVMIQTVAFGAEQATSHHPKQWRSRSPRGIWSPDLNVWNKMLPLNLNDNIKDRFKYHASYRHGIQHIIMYTNCFKSCRYFCFVKKFLSKQTYSKCMWLKCGWVCCYELSQHTINIIHLYIFDRSLECEIILLNTIMMVVKFVFGQNYLS